MKIAVLGSRQFTDRTRLFADLDALRADLGDFTVLSGGCRGADRMGEEWARSRGLPVEVYPADWAKHGRAAGPIRNTQIIEAADRVIAFHDGTSRGTADSIRKAQAAGKPVYIRRFENTPPPEQHPGDRAAPRRVSE